MHEGEAPARGLTRETSDPAWCAGTAREVRASGGAGGVSSMQQAPKGGPGPRTRPSRERVGATSAGRGDPVFAHLVRRVRGDAGSLVRQANGRPGRSGGCGRRRRRRLRPPHRELDGDTFRGSIRTGRRGTPSGRPGRRKARRWALRLGAFGLVVLRAWDRVATSAECSPAGNRWQTTPEGRSGRKTPRVAAVLETATWQGSKPSRE